MKQSREEGGMLFLLELGHGHFHGLGHHSSM